MTTNSTKLTDITGMDQGMTDYECYEKLYGHLAGWVTHYPKPKLSNWFRDYWDIVYKRKICYDKVNCSQRGK